MVLNFLNQLSNAGSFARFSQWNVVVLEFGSPCMPRSPLLMHDSRHDQPWIFPFFTKFFIFNVESIAFMKRTYSRAVFRISRVKSSNRSHRSFWRTDFFAKRINIDLLKTGRVSYILHVIRSHRSFTNWIWNWLGWLEKFCLSSNFSFLLSSNFTFWLSSNFHCGRRGTEKSICSGSLWFSSLGSMGKKNTVCLLLESWTSRYQSIVDNRVKIECASNVVDVMEYSTPNHYIVL